MTKARDAALPPVALLARWEGFCLPCGSEQRPLLLTWQGRRGLRAWLAGDGFTDGLLRLTCGCCGGVDVVGWEDEPDTLLAHEDLSEPATVPRARRRAGPLLPVVAAPVREVHVADVMAEIAALQDGPTGPPAEAPDVDEAQVAEPPVVTEPVAEPVPAVVEAAPALPMPVGPAPAPVGPWFVAQRLTPSGDVALVVDTGLDGDADLPPDRCPSWRPARCTTPSRTSCPCPTSCPSRTSCPRRARRPSRSGPPPSRSRRPTTSLAPSARSRSTWRCARPGGSPTPAVVVPDPQDGQDVPGVPDGRPFAVHLVRSTAPLGPDLQVLDAVRRLSAVAPTADVLVPEDTGHGPRPGRAERRSAARAARRAGLDARLVPAPRQGADAEDLHLVG